MGGGYFTASKPQSVPGYMILHVNTHTLPLCLVSQDHSVLGYMILYAKPHDLALRWITCCDVHAFLRAFRCKVPGGYHQGHTWGACFLQALVGIVVRVRDFDVVFWRRLP